MTELIVVGILLALFAVVVWILVQWKASSPEASFPWKRSDVVLYACMAVCWLGALVTELVRSPINHERTATGVAIHIAACVPCLAISAVIEVRNHRRKTERARRGEPVAEQRGEVDL